MKSSSKYHLRIDSVSVGYADRTVLANVDFSVAARERLGLIGENGAGKSTLLKAAAGLIKVHQGSIQAFAPPALKQIALLHQEPPFKPTASVQEALEEAVSQKRQAVQQVDQAAARLASAPSDPRFADGYASALEKAETLDAWNVDTHISKALAGLGIDGLVRCATTEELSGGQRARLSLACVLLSSPWILLLDEPTNHLDDDALNYLQHELLAWRGPVLFSSHDRTFLDDVATGIIDLDPAPTYASGEAVSTITATDGGITRFTGKYTDYLTARSQARARWEAQYREQQALLRRLRAGVSSNQRVGHVDWEPRTEVKISRKFYADRNAKVVSRRVNDVRGRLKELEEHQLRHPPATLRFRMPERSTLAVSKFSVEILSTAHLSVANRLAPVTFSLGSNEKLLVTGRNGVGKSTLLSALDGSIRYSGGTFTIQDGLRIGRLAQDSTSTNNRNFDPATTLVKAYEALVGVHRAEDKPLAEFGLFTALDLERPFRTLSVGQRRRLALAGVLADPPDLLLLDEPTNHFSLPLVEALEEAIDSFTGSVVVASHDRWIRRRWKHSVLALPQMDGDPSRNIGD